MFVIYDKAQQKYLHLYGSERFKKWETCGGNKLASSKFLSWDIPRMGNETNDFIAYTRIHGHECLFENLECHFVTVANNKIDEYLGRKPFLNHCNYILYSTIGTFYNQYPHMVDQAAIRLKDRYFVNFINNIIESRKDFREFNYIVRFKQEVSSKELKNLGMTTKDVRLSRQNQLGPRPYGLVKTADHAILLKITYNCETMPMVWSPEYTPKDDSHAGFREAEENSHHG